MSLKDRALTHDWFSLEKHDLIERVELIKELRRIPMREVHEILKDIEGEIRHKILIQLAVKET